MISRLEENFPGVRFNGDAKGASLYTVLNVCLPETDKKETLLFNLDIEGISVSGGSACSSGSNVGSHVLTAIGSDPIGHLLDFLLAKNNTRRKLTMPSKNLRSSTNFQL